MVEFHKFRRQFLLPGNVLYEVNNASSEVATSSKAARRDSAFQYPSQVLVDTNVLNQGVTALTQHLISAYNFGAVSPFRVNSSSRPASCFLLSKLTKRYALPVIPEAKADAEFVFQLWIVAASLKVWSYVIMLSENVAQLVPKPYNDLTTRYANLVALMIFTAEDKKLPNAWVNTDL